MRSAIFAILVMGAFGCSATPSAHQQAPSPLTRADSARITAAFLGSSAVDSARYATLREYFAWRDSVEAARVNPRRYTSLRVF